MAEPVNQAHDQLLSSGLKHYGEGRVDEAAKCWRRVLAGDPKNQMARDYLLSAGFGVDVAAAKPTLPANAEVIELNPDPASLATRVRQFLRDKKYDDALDLLIRAKAAKPQNAAAIGRSIQHVKDKIVVEQAKTIGSMDQLVSLNVAEEVVDKLELEEAARVLLGLVDGVTTVGDIVRASTLERHVALTTVGQLHRLRLVRFREATFSLPPSKAADAVSSFYSDEGAPEQEDTLDSTPAAVEFGDSPPHADGYERKFREATLAYMRGDIDEALSLFRGCLVIREGDERALHNIRRLTGAPA